MYYNKAIIIGNITKDPEVRTLPSGIPVATFSVATNRTWKDKDGSKKEDTQFHNVVVFGKQADIVSRYVKKGTLLLVEGRMQTRSWDAQDGSKKYRTEIVADTIQFGPRQGMAGPGVAPAMSAPGEVGKSSSDVIEYPDEPINTEDIPF